MWDLHKNGDGTVQRGREGPADCNIVHWISSRASNEGYPEVREDFTITEKAPTSAFTFKTLLRHYAKQGWLAW